MQSLLDTHVILWWRANDRRLKRAARLPRHHADPFDRMLVAQSEIEDLTLVTHDRALGAYARPILWT